MKQCKKYRLDPTSKPCVIVKRTLGKGVTEAALFVHKKIISKYEPKNIFITLLSAYYAYNMPHVDKCINV